MVRLDLLSSLLAATGVVQAVANTPQIVPGAYIVEYETNEVSSVVISPVNKSIEAPKHAGNCL